MMAEKDGCGIRYWSKIWTRVVEEKSIPAAELMNDATKSYLLSDSNGTHCEPCGGNHEKEYDRCLHCEELLQLTIIHVLLLRAESEEEVNKLIYLLATDYNIFQKLTHRLLALSAFISHVASKVLVSLISLNPSKLFTKEHFEELVVHLLGHCQSKDNVSTIFRLLKKILNAKFNKELSEICLNLIDHFWENIFTKFKEFSSDAECNSEFLKLWKSLFKKHSFISDVKLQTCDTARTFLEHIDSIIATLGNNSASEKWVLKSTLQLFNRVLSYKEDLAVQKHIPHFYSVTCQHLLAASIFKDCLHRIANCSRHAGFGGSEDVIIFQQINSDIHGDITPRFCTPSDINKDTSHKCNVTDDITADISDKEGISSEVISSTAEPVVTNDINVGSTCDMSGVSCNDMSVKTDGEDNISMNTMNVDTAEVRVEFEALDRNTTTDNRHEIIVDPNTMETDQSTSHNDKDTTSIGQETSTISSDTIASTLPNLSLLRKLILLQVNTYVIAVKYYDEVYEQGAKMDLLNRISFEMQHTCSEVEQILSCRSKLSLNHSNQSIPSSSSTNCNLDWLPEIFGDQDDAWIEILLAITDLYVLSKTWYEEQSQAYKLIDLLNPHKLFIQLLKSMAFDHSVLLDLLTSPETYFLLYFLKYLKLVSQEWYLVVQLHKEYSYVAECNRNNYQNPTDNSQAQSSKDEPQQNVYVCSDSTDSASYEMKISREKSQISLHSSASDVHESRSDFNEGSLLTCKQSNEGETEKMKEYKPSIGLSWIQMYSDSEEESVSENNSSNGYTSIGSSLPVCDNISDSCADSSIQNIDDFSLPEVFHESQHNIIKEHYPSTAILKPLTDMHTSVQKSSNGNGIENINRTEDRIDPDTVSHTDDSNSLKPCQKQNDACSKFSCFVSNTLDQTLGCLIRLQFSLERLNRSGMFPYNPEKLIQALQQCICLYES
uniref:Protein Lines C-terminal domain-containing protein n=1 Tax=Octopus bimaculoides TaxID=37653 RepID=A0A0L8H1B2_OCTBM